MTCGTEPYRFTSIGARRLRMFFSSARRWRAGVGVGVGVGALGGALGPALGPGPLGGALGPGAPGVGFGALGFGPAAAATVRAHSSILFFFRGDMPQHGMHMPCESL